MFDYPSLETLRTVEEEGSYGRAARVLGVTRSAISQKVKQLEDRWGTSITLRKPVNATKHGSRLCRHVDQVRLLESKLYLNEGGNFEAHEIEPHAIKLLFDTDLLQTGFLDELLLYVERQNDFEFELIRTNNSAIRSELRPNTISAVISSTWIQSTNMDAHVLGQQEFIAVAHPDYIKRNLSSGCDPSPNRQAICISYGGQANIDDQFLSQVFGQYVTTKTKRLYSNAGVLNACLKQKGWALLPKYAIGNHLSDGDLVELFPGEILTMELYFFISRFVSEVLPEVAETVLSAAKKNLQTNEQ